jgi:hypothetical protein
MFGGTRKGAGRCSSKFHFVLDFGRAVLQTWGLQEGLVMPPADRKPAARLGVVERMAAGLNAALRIEH